MMLMLIESAPPTILLKYHESTSCALSPTNGTFLVFYSINILQKFIFIVDFH